MAIGMVEMQVMINRTQDFQQFQHFENEKAALYQSNQQVQVDQNVERNINQVHEKDNAAENNNADGGDGKQYANGRGARQKKKAAEDRVVNKSTMAFDVRI